MLGALKHLLKDWPKLLEEYGISRSLAEKVNIVSQFRCEVELLLGIYEQVSHVLRNFPLTELVTAPKQWCGPSPRFGSPSLAAKASMFFSAILLCVQVCAPTEGAIEAGSSAAPWAHRLHIEQHSWTVLISESCQ